MGWYTNEYSHGMPDGPAKGFLFDGSGYHDILPPGSVECYITSVSGNNVAGTYYDANYQQHGFIYDGANYTTIDVPGGSSAAIDVISGNGVVGSYLKDGFREAFLFDGTTFSSIPDVPVPNLVDTEFTGISGNKVVGSWGGPYGNYQAFVYTIPEPSSLALVGISAISLISYGCFGRGRRRLT